MIRIPAPSLPPIRQIPSQFLWVLVPLAGIFFAYRIVSIPSRLEIAAFLILAFIIPTLKYPKFGVYYLLSVPLFIPLFRRLYYLVAGRPTLDYLMLISDGVMGGLILSLLLLWVTRKEKIRDRMTGFVLAYIILLALKIGFLNQGPWVEGFYGFKFNGLYVAYYFAGSYLLGSMREIRHALNFAGWMLFLTALYGLQQFLFGFTSFEQKWLDSITFTTLRIDGIVRPFGTYVSPAAMADGMCVLILLGLYFLYRKGMGGRFQGLILMAAAVFPLLLAAVRTSWAAAAAGIFMFAVFLRLRKGWPRWVLFLLVLAGAVFTMVRSDTTADAQSASFSRNLGGPSKSASSILITSRTQALANPLQEYSIRKRFEIWTEIWYFAVRNPLGRGQGTHGYAHSYYFQVLGEIGFPGLFVFLAILYLGFKRGFTVLRLTHDPETAETARYCLSLIFVFTILNLTGTHLHTNPGDLFFWMALGILSQLHRNTVEVAGLFNSEKSSGKESGRIIP